MDITSYAAVSGIRVDVTGRSESGITAAPSQVKERPGSQPTQEAVKLAAKLRARVSDEERILVFADVAERNGGAVSAWEVAQAMAQSCPGQVLLIDADVANPTLHKRCKVPLKPGFADMVRRGRPETLAIHMADSLAVMPAGTDYDLSSLLSSAELATVLAALKKQYRWIVVAAPPALEGAQAGLIASRGDEIVLIVTAGKSSRRELLAAKRELDGLRAPVVGVAIYRG